MLKITNKENKVSYILTEAERVSLASKESIDLVNSKINEIEKYTDTNIDFFTGNEVKEENLWYFNVSKGGKLYTCVYDNNHQPEDLIQREVRLLLMWRFEFGPFTYTEVIGEYIDSDYHYSVQVTDYCDVYDYIHSQHKNEGEKFEEIVLTGENKMEVREDILY
jgi:hypothetical protein